MKIDHMIFNSKKYWEGTQPNYIGKKIKVPQYLLINRYYSGNLLGDFFSKVTNGNGEYMNCIPQNGDTILGQGMNVGSDEVFITTKGTAESWFALSDLVKNGGVLPSLLTHLYQCFKVFTTRKVASAL